MNMEETVPPSGIDRITCQSLEESYYWLRLTMLHDCIEVYATAIELGIGEGMSREGQTLCDTRPSSELFEEPEETTQKTVLETVSTVEGLKSADTLYDGDLVEKTQADIIVDSLSDTIRLTSSTCESDSMQVKNTVVNCITKEETGIANTSVYGSISEIAFAFENDMPQNSCNLSEYETVTFLSGTDEMEKSESIISATLSQNLSIESNIPPHDTCFDDSHLLLTETTKDICLALAENYVFLKWGENCASAEELLCKNDPVQCFAEEDAETCSSMEKEISDSSSLNLESPFNLITDTEESYYLIKWTFANASGEEMLGLIQSESNVHELVLKPSDVLSLMIGDTIVNQIRPSTVDNIATHDALLIPKNEGTFNPSLTLSDLSDSRLLTELPSKCSISDEFEHVKTGSGLPSLDEKFFKEFTVEDNIDDWLKTEYTLNSSHTQLESDSFDLGELVSIPSIPDAFEKSRTASGMSSSDDGWSDKVILNKNKECFTTIDVAVQTDCTETAHQETQTDNDSVSVEAQTEGEIVQCCQCNVYSFLPLGEQFVIRLKEEMSQRLTLENLIKIVEKDAWIVRTELMDEKEIVISLQGEAADLKGQVTHARHISSELKTRNDELQTSLEGARNMINKLEQQMSNTTYFNSGIDYMLEAKLAQGRSVEAISKVEVLQKELLHSQSEVQKLLKQLGQLSQEKNTMVSSAVHKELLQIANDKVTDTELRSLKLENEVFALKEENKQLKSLSLSSQSDLPFPSISKPYKFMFTEQIDPYKEIMSMKYDMLNLHASSLSLRAESPPLLSYTPKKEEKEDIQTDTVLLPTSNESALPDFSDISYNLQTLTSTEIPSELSRDTSPRNNAYQTSSLIATGSDSEESDWSDDEVSDVTPRKLKAEPVSGIVGQRIKPPVPVKPTVAPKPKGVILHPGLMGGRSRTVSYNLLPQAEGGVSFDEAPSVPILTVHRKPRGPQGRQPPTRFNQ